VSLPRSTYHGFSVSRKWTGKAAESRFAALPTEQY